MPCLTALQNVQVALEINDLPARLARRQATELLERLGVADRAFEMEDGRLRAAESARQRPGVTT